MCCGIHPSTPRDFRLHPQQVTPSLVLFFLVSHTLFLNDLTIPLSNRKLPSTYFSILLCFKDRRYFNLDIYDRQISSIRGRDQTFLFRRASSLTANSPTTSGSSPVPSDQGGNLLTQFYQIPRVRTRGSSGLRTRPLVLVKQTCGDAVRCDTMTSFYTTAHSVTE